MSELRDWLRVNGLEQYADAFEANDIGLDILPDLSDSDLEPLSVSLGNRRRLLKAIAERAAAPPKIAGEIKRPDASSDAERRQVTVLFCDMVGSTALSGAVDPELLGGLIRRYQDAVGGAIGRFGGFVAKFMGDGVLAYFGFPQAFEDAAERAVRSRARRPLRSRRSGAAGRRPRRGAHWHRHRTCRGRRNHRHRQRAASCPGLARASMRISQSMNCRTKAGNDDWLNASPPRRRVRDFPCGRCWTSPPSGSSRTRELRSAARARATRRIHRRALPA